MALPSTHAGARRRSEIWEHPGVLRAFRRAQKLLGGRLRALRLARKLSQEQAAEKIGLAAKQLSRVESGAKNVTLGTLVAIAHAYKIDLGDLFDRAAMDNVSR